MNSQQRNIIKVAILFVITSFLFPPFYETGGNGRLFSNGYGFLLSGSQDGLVNVPLLFAEWGVILLVSTGIFLLSKEPIEVHAGFIKKLIDGQFGIAKTFWIFLIIPQIVVLIVGKMLHGNYETIFVMGALAYLCVALRGSFVASKARNVSAWAMIFTQLFVCVNAVGLLVLFIYALSSITW